MSSRTCCAQNISINKNCRNQLNSLSLLILCHRGGGVDERKKLQREAEELIALVEQTQGSANQQREEAEARANSGYGGDSDNVVAEMQRCRLQTTVGDLDARRKYAWIYEMRASSKSS